MPKITIRPMNEADIGSCAALMAHTPLWQRYGITVEGAAARLADVLASGGTILVAEESGETAPLGFVWIVERGAFNRSGYIPLIGVDPAHRGGGIGKQLLEAAENHVRQTSQDLFLLCSDFNTDAQRFYEQHGYARVGAIPDYVVAGITELIYRKHL
jgi:ribosomal protein S18 acetylase RimI-like enzyme